MTTEIPEPWATAFKRAKMTDPRNGNPSRRALAEAIGANASTISDMLTGQRKTSVTTIEQVAAALNVDPSTVAGWVGATRETVRPYTPPSESSYLTARQRKAVDELIRAMTVEVGHESQPGQSPPSPQHRSTDSSEDGSTPSRPGAPMSDFPTFGTPRRVGDLGDGPLDEANTMPPDELSQRRPPIPEKGDAAAYTPRNPSKGRKEHQDSQQRGEESQNPEDEQ